MKGLSVVLSLALLVLAQQLALQLSRVGALPRQKELTPRPFETARRPGRRGLSPLFRARVLAPAATAASDDPSTAVIQL